jgi:N-acyl-D-amino-acid deacylase
MSYNKKVTLLIKNGLVYDGSGSPPVQKDIFIQGERIARLGNFSRKSADTVLDATGAIVTPGFIDINTDSDHYLSLFYEPHQHDFIKQGVTTIIGGNCGASLAPLLDGSLDSIRKWGVPSRINVNWQSVKEFLDILEHQGLGVNFGTLVGHSTVRRALVEEHSRDLTDAEINVFRDILIQSFKDGAYGFSTGLSYIHSRKVSYYEIKMLAEVTALFGRVYATHLRNYDTTLLSSLEEAIDIAKETGVNLEISHLEPLRGYAQLYLQASEILHKASTEIGVNFDVYPFNSTALALYTFLPPFIQEGNLEIMLERISSPLTEGRVLEYLTQYADKEMTIGHVNDETLKFLEGKSLKDYAANEGMDFAKAFLKFMRITRLRAIIFYKNIDTTLLESFLSHPHSIISSNGTSLSDLEFKHERNYSTFPVFLKMVAEKNLMPLEAAIAKVTSVPAKKYRIRERGVLKSEYFADIVVLKDSVPRDVVLNGELAMQNGQMRNNLNGQILRCVTP